MKDKLFRVKEIEEGKKWIVEKMEEEEEFPFFSTLLGLVLILAGLLLLGILLIIGFGPILLLIYCFSFPFDVSSYLSQNLNPFSSQVWSGIAIGAGISLLFAEILSILSFFKERFKSFFIISGPTLILILMFITPFAINALLSFFGVKSPGLARWDISSTSGWGMAKWFFFSCYFLDIFSLLALKYFKEK
jgi:hypothetical protein